MPQTIDAWEEAVLADPNEEQQFRTDYGRIVEQRRAMGMPLDPDPYNPEHKYDYFAAWKAGDLKIDERGHFPSPYKADDHPNRFISGEDTRTGKRVDPWEQAVLDYKEPKRGFQDFDVDLSGPRTNEASTFAGGPSQPDPTIVPVGGPIPRPGKPPGPYESALARLPPEQAARVRAGQAEMDQPSTGEYIVNAIQAAGKGVASGVAAIPKSIALLDEGIYRAFLTESERKQLAPVEENPAYQIGRAIDQFAEDVLPLQDPRQAESFITEQLPQGAGSMATFIAGSVGGRLLRMGEWAVTALLGAGVEAASIFEDAKAHGADDMTALKASGWGIPIGFTEALPISRILDRFGGARGLKKALVEAFKGFVEEGSQELGQQVGENLAAMGYYDADREVFGGTASAGGAGGILGFVASMGASLLGLRARRLRLKEIQQQRSTDTRRKLELPQGVTLDPVMRYSKESLLSPSGAAAFAERNPDLAAAIAAKPSPSRTDVAAVPLERGEKLEGPDRTRLSQLLREQAQPVQRQPEAPQPSPQQETTDAVRQTQEGQKGQAETLLAPKGPAVSDAQREPEPTPVRAPSGAKYYDQFDEPDIVAARERASQAPATYRINTPEREQLREQIADKVYGNGAPRKDRQATVVVGLPGAGKSTISRPLAEQTGSILIDADIVREQIPEYAADKSLGSATQKEASEIAYNRVLGRAAELGDNIVLNTVGADVDVLRSRIKELKDAGYSVNLVHVRLPPREAAKRAVTRFRDPNDGRFLDPASVLKIGNKPRNYYNAVKKEDIVSGYAEYDNSVPAGQPPRLIEEGGLLGRPQSSGVREPSGDVAEREVGGDRPQEESGSGGREQQPAAVTDLPGRIAQRLESPEKLHPSELFKLADESFGGTRAEGKYGPSDAYDALETGVNLYLQGKTFPQVSDAETAAQGATWIEGILDRLPTQTNRSGEKDSFQQFSTPPHYAYAAAWLANIKPDDVVLEPSAGTGSLAVQAKNAHPAWLHGNELSTRRAEFLKQIQPDDITNEDAEQIHNIFPAQGKKPPTVVIMNPPFSRAGARMGNKKILETGANHIEAALKFMAPDGRLVAIVGRGMDISSKRFGDWWRGIQKVYNVRANVAVSGDVYKKYGTSFGTRLLVIDKTGPTPDGGIVTGEVASIEDLVHTLAGVRNDRASGPQPQSAQPTGQGPPSPARTESGPTVPVQPSVGEVDTGRGAVPAAKSGGSVRVGAEGTRRSDVGVEPGEGTVLADDRTGGTSSKSGEDRGGNDRGRGTEGRRGDARGDSVPQPSGVNAEPESGGPAVAPKQVEVSQPAPKSTNKRELTESVFETYEPSKVKVKGAKPHPASVVESAAMSAVAPPDPSYRPHIPQDVIDRGDLSEIQLEAILYAGQAHSQSLPAGQDEPAYRRGYMLGDGTGIGKGRTIAGTILDNWQQGRKKAVWLSLNDKLFDDAKRDWTGIGQSADNLFQHSKVKSGGSVEAKEGILFSTYTTLTSEPKSGGKSRLEQIVDWLGPDFDGVIAFDEAHKMGSAITTKGKRGSKKPSKAALTGIELQARLPKARILYVSATAATEVENLAYADRLGIWGKDTPFPTKEAFVAEISNGGVAAMELVARDLKAMGLYLARSISFNDGTPEGTVTYERLEHPLTEDQRESYDTLARAWQIVLRNINEALQLTGGDQNANAKSTAYSQFWGAHQRFFNQIITSMQTPTVIRAIEQDIANERSAVVQLTNTHEAAQERALAKRGEEDDLEDFDITPRDSLMQLVEHGFPTAQFEEYADEDGNIRTRPVRDANGNFVQNREAVEKRDRLLDQLGSISVPDSPMDMIINHFGEENVSEVTGRNRRVVSKLQPDGTRKKEIERRSKLSRKSEIQRFMGGKKRLLIFSEAGGTGASYHADRLSQNQQKRSHYLLQAGWRADSAIQGLGRTHRSNQKQAPTYVLVHTDLKGQKRFLSTIARRLSQLGALTKGQRQAGSGGVFSAADNLESAEAREALYNFYRDLYHGAVKAIDINSFESQTGLRLVDENGGLRKDLPPITQFLNRLLSLDFETMNNVFDAFDERLQDAVERAVKQGTLDVGVENFRADRIDKKSEQVVYSDPETGAQTKYVQLRVGDKVVPLEWDEVNKGKRLGGRAPEFFVQSVKTDHVFAVAKASDRTDTSTGRIMQRYRLAGVATDRLIDAENIDKDREAKNWRVVEKEAAKKQWAKDIEGLPEFRERDEHLITGLVLPIWDRLRGKPRIFRLQTDQGEQMLGRVVPAEDVRSVLKSLGATVETPNMAPSEAVKRLLAGEVSLTLSNGWKIKPALVQGERRIEITGPDYQHSRELSADGVITERIQFKTRYFIPAGESSDRVFSAVTRARPVTEVEERSTARRAQAAADEDFGATGGQAFSGFPIPAILGGVSDKVRPDRIPEPVRVADDEIEDRMQSAHGVERPSLTRRVKQVAESAWHKATRAQEFLPNNAEFAPANEFFRLLKNVPTQAADEVNRTVASVIDPMGPKQLALFERYIQTENMIASAKRGEPLRFGFSNVEQLEEYKRQLEVLVDQTPEVKRSLDTRAKVVKELVDELVRFDILDDKALENTDAYFHQQVLNFLEVDRIGSGGGAQKVKRSFQRRRVKGIEALGREYDYNTSYIEAEASWMTDAIVELEKEKRIRELAQRYDILPQLKKQAKAQNFETLVGGPEMVKRINLLRAQISESSEGGNAAESDERAARKAMIEELEKIDPTYPFRKRIARLSDSVRKAIRQGKVTGPAVQAFLGKVELDADYGDTESRRWFAALQEVAKNYKEDPVGRAALGIFRAIDERNKLIQSTLGERFVTWNDLLRERKDFDVWQPEPGNLFYQAVTIPQKIVEQLQSDAVESLQLTRDQLRTVLAMGGPRRQFVMPTPLINQLAATDKAKPTGPLGAVSLEAIRGWKVWQLFNPKRAIPYMLRNVTGDIDPVLGGAPGVLKYLPRVTGEIHGYYSGKLSLTDDLRTARDLGVVSSSLTASEIPDLKDLDVFRRFYESKSSLLSAPARLANEYFERVKRFNEFRESLLRYAAYRYYLDQLNRGKKLEHYGGAKKEVVDALRKDMGNAVAAAHLARNLLGDYGNLTVFGNWMREHLSPFWSWQEINAKRWPRLAINAVEFGRARGKGSLWASSVYSGLAAVQLAAMYGSFWAWNHFVFPDEEKDLGIADRANPHINLGRNDDGSVRVFRNAGALGEFGEWFGINDLMSLLPQYVAGQITGGDLIREMGKSPINKIVQGLRPELKGGYEVLTGQSLYPDVTTPRTVDRGEAAADIFGLSDEYRAARGAVLEEGSRSRPNYLQRWLMGVVDPRKNALHTMYDLREKFLKQEGRESPNFQGTSPFRNMRIAAMDGDYEAFKESREAYLEAGKNYKSFKASLSKLDPIASRLSDEDEAKFETQFLTDQQRQKLRVSRDYARELEIKLWHWWNEAAADDSPEAQAGLKAEIRHDLAGRAKVLARPIPMSKAKREQWRRDVDAALEWMRRRDVTPAQARSAYLREVARKMRTASDRETNLRRLSTQLRKLKAS